MSDHISVCICTYKRPALLGRLLKELEMQINDGLFTYSVVVVDNDSKRSAEKTVLNFKQQSSLDISYYCEPEQSYSLARNMAVGNAKGNLIAFIDDDELPGRNWLLCLYNAYIKYGADGILGPVKPHYEIEPPGWVIAVNIRERVFFKTGTVLTNSAYTRTGNVLLSKRIFSEENIFFDPVFGRIGGEDIDLFKRMMQRGRIFIWCDEAAIYETVPPERCNRVYFLKRSLLRGMVHSRNESLFSASALRSTTAFIIYTVSLPFLFLLGQNIFMRYLTKTCDHLGLLLGLFGIRVIKDRDF